MLKRIKLILGRSIAYAGAALCDLGTNDTENTDKYDDLKWYGKLGYHIMVFGWEHAGFPIKKLNEAVDAYLKAKAEET